TDGRVSRGGPPPVGGIPGKRSARRAPPLSRGRTLRGRRPGRPRDLGAADPHLRGGRLLGVLARGGLEGRAPPTPRPRRRLRTTPHLRGRSLRGLRGDAGAPGSRRATA